MPKHEQINLPQEICDEIMQMRQEGKSLRQIARSLNERKIPTAHNGPSKKGDGTRAQWWAKTVLRVLQRSNRAEL